MSAPKPITLDQARSRLKDWEFDVTWVTCVIFVSTVALGFLIAYGNLFAALTHPPALIVSEGSCLTSLAASYYFRHLALEKVQACKKQINELTPPEQPVPKKEWTKDQLKEVVEGLKVSRLALVFSELVYATGLITIASIAFGISVFVFRHVPLFSFHYPALPLLILTLSTIAYFTFKKIKELDESREYLEKRLRNFSIATGEIPEPKILSGAEKIARKAKFHLQYLIRRIVQHVYSLFYQLGYGFIKFLQYFVPFNTEENKFKELLQLSKVLAYTENCGRAEDIGKFAETRYIPSLTTLAEKNELTVDPTVDCTPFGGGVCLGACLYFIKTYKPSDDVKIKYSGGVAFEGVLLQGQYSNMNGSGIFCARSEELSLHWKTMIEQAGFVFVNADENLNLDKTLKKIAYLEDGKYIFNIPTEKAKHAITLIKEGDKCILYDPNYFVLEFADKNKKDCLESLFNVYGVKDNIRADNGIHIFKVDENSRVDGLEALGEAILPNQKTLPPQGEAKSNE